MKFKVSGENVDTAARMTLEFEAPSKAAAEKKAALQGMRVHRVEIIDSLPDVPTRRVPAGENRVRAVLLFLLFVAILLAWIYRAAILAKFKY